MSSRSPIYLFMLSVLSFNAYAGINKWVDENNQIHYSDQPPPANVKATPLSTPVEPASVAPTASAPSTASASEVAAPKTLAEREADFRKSQKAKEELEKKEAKQKEEERTRQKYCEDARSNLLTLENSRRISTYDSKGELVYMDDAARNQRMNEARQGISKHCK